MVQKTSTTENAEEEKIKTLRPNGKEGVLMLKSIYEMIRFEIVTTLYENQHLTLTNLLDKCQQKCCNQRGEICWLILQVKLDIETKGLIKSFFPPGGNGMMHIKLTRTGRQQRQQELKESCREIELSTCI